MLLERLDDWGIPVRPVIVAVSITLVGLVIISFARVTVAAYQINDQKRALQANVEQLKATNTQLSKKLAFFRTDAGAEQLAREELNWTRPGDTGVVVVASGPSVAAPLGAPPVSAPKSPEKSNLVKWRELLFGK